MFVVWPNVCAASEGLGVALTVPDICVLVEVCSLGPYDAKPLPCWRLHHPPRFHFRNSFGAKALQSSCFCLDIVCFNIEMNPALMLYRLNKDFHLVWRTFEQSIRF